MVAVNMKVLYLHAVKFQKYVIRLIFISLINNIIHEAFVKFRFEWIDNLKSSDDLYIYSRFD